MFIRLMMVVLFSTLLASCAGMEDKEMGRGTGTPGEFKIGKPYEINGVRYYPKEDYRYTETGIASWYGPGFEGKRTANGETFDPNELTAAHQTLPMPSLVRVTNLENGRSVVVRINDRGPFANNRIIDLSKRSAQLLDFVNNGTAKVRVQILEIESKAIANAARRRGYVAPNTTMMSQVNTMPPPPVAEIPAGDMSREEEIRVTDAGVTSVEAAPLEAPQGMQQQAHLETPPVQQMPIIQPSTLKNVEARAMPQPLVAEPKFKSLAGKSVGGRFLPAPEVRQDKVTSSKRIFVQVGAFSVQENAKRLRTKMESVAKASVSETSVGGKKFFRVRLGPISSVQEADRILAKVLPENNSARITVE